MSSIQTRIVSVVTNTVMGPIDWSRGVATVSLVYTTSYVLVNTRTVTNTRSYEVASQIITKIIRTATLRYGNIFTSTVIEIPTRIVRTVITRTIAGGGGGAQPTPVPKTPEKLPQ